MASTAYGFAAVFAGRITLRSPSTDANVRTGKAVANLQSSRGPLTMKFNLAHRATISVVASLRPARIPPTNGVDRCVRHPELRMPVGGCGRLHGAASGAGAEAGAP